MPIYTYKGKRFNISEDKEEAFLKDLPSAKLVSPNKIDAYNKPKGLSKPVYEEPTFETPTEELDTVPDNVAIEEAKHDMSADRQLDDSFENPIDTVKQGLPEHVSFEQPNAPQSEGINYNKSQSDRRMDYLTGVSDKPVNLLEPKENHIAKTSRGLWEADKDKERQFLELVNQHKDSPDLFKELYEQYKKEPELFRDGNAPDKIERRRKKAWHEHLRAGSSAMGYHATPEIDGYGTSGNPNAVGTIESEAYLSKLDKEERNKEKDNISDFFTNTDVGRRYLATQLKSEQDFKNGIAQQVDEILPSVAKLAKKEKEELRLADLDKNKRDPEKESAYTYAMARSGQGRGFNVGRVLDEYQGGAYGVAEHFLEDSQRIINEAGKEKNWAKAIGRGLKDSLFDVDNWVFGITEADRNSQIQTAAQKSDKGEKLTEAETAMMDALALNLAVNQYYSGDMQRQYGWGETAGVSTPYMIEFMLNPISGAGKGVAKSIAKYGVKKFGAEIGKAGIKRGATKVGARAIGELGQGFGMVVTSGAMKTYADAIDRMTGDGDYNITEDGTIEYSGHTGGKSSVRSITEAMTAGMFEYQSEAMGGSGLLGSMMNNKAMRGVARGLKTTQIGKLVGRMNSSQARQTFKQLEEKAQWNGLFEEWFEEAYGTFVNAITVGDQELSELTDLEQQVDTFMGLSITAGTMSGLRTASYGKDLVGTNRQLRNSRKLLSDHFDNAENVINQFNDLSAEERVENLTGILLRDDITVKAKQAFISFAQAQNYHDALRGAGEAIAEKNLEDAQRNGERLATTIQDQRSIALNRLSLEMQGLESVLGEFADAPWDDVIDEGMTPEMYEAKTQYGIAKAEYETVLNTVKNDAEQTISTLNKAIDDVTREDGTVVEVELGTIDHSDKRYVVRGHVEFHPEEAGGGVDRTKSDNTIIVKGEDGKKSQISISTVTDGAVNDAATMKEEAKQQAYKLHVDPLVAKLEGRTSFSQGEHVQFIDEKGDAHSGTVVETTPETTTVVSNDGKKTTTHETNTLGEQLIGDSAGEYKIRDTFVVYIDGKPYNAEIQNITEGKAEVHIPGAEQASERIMDLDPAQIDAMRIAPIEELSEISETSGEEVQSEETTNESELEIPKDETGNPIYENIEDPQTYLGALGEEFADTPEDIAEIVESKREEAEQTLKDAADIKDVIERKRAEKQAKKNIQFWNDVTSLQKEQAREQEIKNTPDVVYDTAEAAQKRGFRVVNGEVYERQEEQTTDKYVEKERMFTTKEPNTPVKRTVREGSTLQPSHINKTKNNSFFLGNTQPKNREGADSDTASDAIVTKVNPEQITGGVTAYVGQPVANARGEVIQGNNRVASLQRMYRENAESAKKYKDYLMAHAEEFGMTAEEISAMGNPIAVDIAEVDDATALHLGQFVAADTESGGSQRMDPKRIAVSLGNKVNNFADILFLDKANSDLTLSELSVRNGKKALEYLVRNGYINQTQALSAVDKAGNITTEARTDMEGIAAQVLFDGAIDTLPTMFDTLPSSAKRSIMQTIHRDADSDKGNSILKEIQNAIQAYYILQQDETFMKASGKSYKDALIAANAARGAGELFNPNSARPLMEYSNFAMELAVLFRTDTQKALRQRFNNLYDSLQGVTTDAFARLEAEENGELLKLPLVDAINKHFNNINYVPTRQDERTTLDGDSDGSTEQPEGAGETDSSERDTQGEQPTDNRGGTETDSEGLAEESKETSIPKMDGRKQLQFISEIGKLQELFNTNIVPHTSTSTITDLNVRRAINSGRVIKGWFDVNSGKVHIFLNHNESVADIQSTFFHEVIGHKGVRDMLGKDCESMLDDVYGKLPEEVALRVYEKYRNDESFNDRSDIYIKRLIADEFIAEIAETAGYKTQEGGVFQTIIEAIKRFFLANKLEYSFGEAEKLANQLVQESAARLKDKKKVDDAVAEVDTNPSEAQKEAGNYKKGHVNVAGFDITIENPKNTDRKGVDAQGNEWSTTMNNHYGYFKRTKGKDGDHIDVFVGDNTQSDKVFVVDQINEDGSFDEHKVMLGFDSVEQAQEAYLANYEDGWQGLGNITETTLDNFKKWTDTNTKKQKPFAGYKEVEKSTGKESLQVEKQSEKVYGADNKVVSKDRYKELREKMQAKLNNLNTGFDPELFAMGAEMAAYHIEAGARKFAEFAKAMVNDLGDGIKPYLKAFYEGARHMPGMEKYSKEIDTSKTVKEYNLKDTETDNKQDAKDVIEVAQDTKTKDNEQSTKREGESSQRGSQETDTRLGEDQQKEVGGVQRSGVDKGSKSDSSTDTDRSRGLSNTPTHNQVRNVRNNRNEKGEDNTPKSPKARFNANIAAIKLMRKLIDSGTTELTQAQKNTLLKYSGWGGIGTFFNNQSPENVQLKEALSGEEYQNAMTSINSAYFTPAPVIDSLWGIAEKLGFEGGNILESSAGIGSILGLMPQNISERSNIEGVEIDPISGNILKLLYPDAKINIQGFEETNIKNGSIDLAITNVPFITGFEVFDKVDRDLSKQFKNIHDYFIAKNIRKLRAGGLGIFITSSGTLDNSKHLREWVIGEGKADVIGAFRLNNETFGGTTATSDIIIVRKRAGNKPAANAIDIQKSTVVKAVKYDTGETEWKDGKYVKVERDAFLEYNSYFVDNPQNMGGEMAIAFEKGDTFRPTAVGLYPKRGFNQQEALDGWVNSMKALEQVEAEQEKIRESEKTEAKEGQLILDSKGVLSISRDGQAEDAGINTNKVRGYQKSEALADYNAIKETLDAVLEHQLENKDDKTLEPLIKKLNDAYDTFVDKYGNLNKNTAISFLKYDVDFPAIEALEDYSEQVADDGTRTPVIKKADVFNGRVVGFKATPAPTNVKDGVISSIHAFGSIDLGFISKHLGITSQEVQSEILKDGLGFVNPSTGSVEVSYEYLSGNVREKLQLAKDSNIDGEYQSNIDALEKVIPMDIPAHLIEFNLGATYIDSGLYKEYVNENFGVKISLYNTGGAWVMEDTGGRYNDKNRQKGVASGKLGMQIYGSDLFEAAINNKTIVFKKTETINKEKITYYDKEATAAAQARIAEIKDGFKDWARDKMQSSKELGDKTAKLYNERSNAVVPLTISEEFLPERFEGASTSIDLYHHQKAAVIKGTQQPLMLAHEVGTGKTFTLISTAMEMRRLGTAKKPMIVVQNSTIGQFVAEAKKLYPNAKVLSYTPRDSGEAGRKSFYSKIKYNDWDIIVIPQSTLDQIPDSQDRQMTFIKEKIEDKIYSIESMKESDVDSGDIQRAEKELKKLEEEMSGIANGELDQDGKKIKKDAKAEAKARNKAKVGAQKQLDRKVDNVKDFDDLGVDALLIDEAHAYKRLGFATSMSRVAKGIDPAGSKRAAGVYLKTRAVLEKSGGKNVVFATGTPISNTAGEIWTFMKYLIPRQTMEENGIYYFDDFVRNFGKVDIRLSFGTNGKYREQNRFAQYLNKPELIRLWRTVADTVLTKDIGYVNDKVPNMEGGEAQDVFLPQTLALRTVMRGVRAELEAFENMSGKEKKENSHIPLVMFGIAKRAAIDARLVDKNASDDVNSKTNKAVEQTLQSLKDTEKYKGTIAIFSDQQNRRESDKVVFDLFEDIKSKLIAKGVPANQIMVMKSGMSPMAKERTFADVNSGAIRVIIGNTATLGTGVNIQERLHTLIHMDAPQRPMDYTQRNGRILRQGNLHKRWDIPVKVIRYGVEDSMDVSAYDTLKTKEGFINGIMDGAEAMENNQINRILEEDDEAGLFDNPVAHLSGSASALLKQKAERDMRALLSQKKQHEVDQIYISNTTKSNESRVAFNEKRIGELKTELELINKNFPKGEAQEITIEGKKVEGEEQIEKALTDINKEQSKKMEAARRNGRFETGHIDFKMNIDGVDFTFRVDMKREVSYDAKVGATVIAMRRNVSYSSEQLGIENKGVSGGYVKNALNEILSDVVSGSNAQNLIESLERSNQKMKESNELYAKRMGKAFEGEAELKIARERVKEYTAKMVEEIKAQEEKYAKMDAEAAENDIDYDQDDDDVDSDVRFRESDRPQFTYPIEKVKLAVDNHISLKENDSQENIRFREGRPQFSDAIETVVERFVDRVTLKENETQKEAPNLKELVFFNDVKDYGLYDKYEIVPVSNPVVNIQNLNRSIYGLGAELKPLNDLHSQALLNFEGDTGYLNQEKVKEFSNKFEGAIEPYETALLKTKHFATEAAQKEIMDIIRDIDHARNYYERLAKDHSVLRTEESPRFRQADRLFDNIDNLKNEIEDYPHFLNNVLQKSPVRELIMLDAKQRGYSNLDKSIESYLSKLQDPKELKRIKQELNVDMPDAALQYLLWRNANPNDGSATWKAKNAIREHELKYDVRFRGDEKVFRANEYERRVSNKTDKWYSKKRIKYELHEGYVDRMISLRHLQEAIAGGVSIADGANAYIMENLLSSKNQAEIENFVKRNIDPMVERSQRIFGTDMDAIDLYLIAKHGLERNEVMARNEAYKNVERDTQEAHNEIDADTESKIKQLVDSQLESDLNTLAEKENELRAKGEGNKELAAKKIELAAEKKYDTLVQTRDYAGLTDLALERGMEAEEFTEAGRQIVEEMNEKHGEEELNKLWLHINKANQWMLKKQYDSGILTQERYEEISKMYENYVPLRGFDEKVATDIYDYLITPPSSFSGVVKKARGRSSRASSPMANMINMAESGIMQANRNRMKQAFYRLVVTSGTDLATVKDVWTVLHGDEWMEEFPQVPETASVEEIKTVLEEFESRMIELEGKGLAQRKSNKLNIGVKIFNPQAAEHAVRVWVNGEEKIVYVNGNPRAAQALNGLTNSAMQEKSRTREWLEYAHRQMSANFTSRNPVFLVTNFSRDMQYALMAASVKEGAHYSAQLALNSTKVGKTIAQNIWGKGNAKNPELQALYEEFVMNGGETGYANLQTVDHHRKYVNDKLRSFSDKKDWKHGFRVYARNIQNANQLIENNTRFATYVTSRQNGRSIQRSVSDAKEITVNFNRKGSGGAGASVLHGLFLFVNPTIQAANMLAGMAKKRPKQLAALMGTVGTTGFMVPFMNEVLINMFGDDDDKELYYNINPWVRRNNLVMYMPWTKDKFVTIMLPHEVRAIYGMGEMAYGAITGKTRHENFSREAMGMISDMFPVDMAGSHDWFIPDALKPIWQAYVSNKNFMDRPIYRDNDWNKMYPEWTKAYKSTPLPLVELYKWVNELTGGDDVKQGKINLNPARTNALFNGYMGGFAQVYTDIASLIYDGVAGNDISINQIPFASKVVRTSDEKTKELRLNGEYFHYVDWVNQFTHLETGYRKNLSDAKYKEKYKNLYKDRAQIKDALYAKSQIAAIKRIQKVDEEGALKMKRQFVEEMHRREDNK